MISRGTDYKGAALLPFVIFLIDFNFVFLNRSSIKIKHKNPMNILFFRIRTDLQHWLFRVDSQSFRGTSRRYYFDQSLSMVWRYGWRRGDAVVCAGKLVTVHQPNDVC